MSKRPSIFVSYSRRDERAAIAMEKALRGRNLAVWRDARSILAGERWFDAIEQGIRSARGVVVLLSDASASSDWVTYEYAYATGARIPVIAVVLEDARVPKPIRNFQVVEYTSQAEKLAERIDEGLQRQSRAAVKSSGLAVRLVAKFQEVNGEVETAGSGRLPSLCMELWIEGAPKQTRNVAFEIPDRGFRDREWTVRRTKRKSGAFREFLTDRDMNSYGEAEIWARGIGPGAGTWTVHTTLYKALSAYYRGRNLSAEIRKALKQIRDN